jgi:ankyrin repeat protein
MNALVRLDVLQLDKTDKVVPFNRFWRHKNRVNTQLLEAVASGQVDVVMKLISPLNPVDDTAEVRHVNKNGQGAVHLAITNSKVNILKKLIEYDKTLLHMKTEDTYSETPLHMAVRKRNQPILKLLLNEFNATVVVKDSKGNTPMHLAIQAKDISMVKLLAQVAGRQL